MYDKLIKIERVNVNQSSIEFQLHNYFQKFILFTRFVLVLHVSHQQRTDYCFINWSIHWFSIHPARNQEFSDQTSFLADTLCAVIVWVRRSGSRSGSRKDQGRVQSSCSRTNFHHFRSVVHTVRPWKCVQQGTWRASGTALERHLIAPYTWSKCLDSVAKVPKNIVDWSSALMQIIRKIYHVTNVVACELISATYLVVEVKWAVICNGIECIVATTKNVDGD